MRPRACQSRCRAAGGRASRADGHAVDDPQRGTSHRLRSSLPTHCPHRRGQAQLAPLLASPRPQHSRRSSLLLRIAKRWLMRLVPERRHLPLSGPSLPPGLAPPDVQPVQSTLPCVPSPCSSIHRATVRAGHPTRPGEMRIGGGKRRSRTIRHRVVTEIPSSHATSCLDRIRWRPIADTVFAMETTITYSVGTPAEVRPGATFFVVDEVRRPAAP